MRAVDGTYGFIGHLFGASYLDNSGSDNSGLAKKLGTVRTRRIWFVGPKGLWRRLGQSPISLLVAQAVYVSASLGRGSVSFEACAAGFG